MHANPFRYGGQYYDKETSTYYLRARYYDPVIGRFTQQDPHWNTGNMIYGDDPVELASGLYAPSLKAIVQSGNRYPYAMNNPVKYVDENGEIVFTTGTLLIGGGALLFGGIGGLLGNHIAEEKGAEGWDKAGYIAGGAVIGGVGGGLLGAAAAPAVVTATGVSGISVTTSGVSAIAATGTSFGTLGTLITNNGSQIVDWGNTTMHGMQRMLERGVTQDMVDKWVATGKALQQSGDKILYVTQEGAAVVNKAGRLITTYSSAYFDENMQNVVKRLFGS